VEHFLARMASTGSEGKQEAAELTKEEVVAMQALLNQKELNPPSKGVAKESAAPLSGTAAAAAAAAAPAVGSPVGAIPGTDAKEEMKEPEPRQTKWSAECAAALPKFSLVRDNLRTVDQWCTSVRTVLSEYWGPKSLMCCALVEAVGFKEFKDPSFEPSDYTVDSLLDFIAQTWKQCYDRSTVALAMKKDQSESWREFLSRLRAWAASMRLNPSDDWYLDQLRGNADITEDIYLGQTIPAEKWALAMDTQRGAYNREKLQRINLVQSEIISTPTEVEDEPVASIQRGTRKSLARHQYAKNGQPICDFCHQEGHIARDCQKKKGKRGRGRRRPYNQNTRQ